MACWYLVLPVFPIAALKNLMKLLYQLFFFFKMQLCKATELGKPVASSYFRFRTSVPAQNFGAEPGCYPSGVVMKPYDWLSVRVGPQKFLTRVDFALTRATPRGDIISRSGY